MKKREIKYRTKKQKEVAEIVTLITKDSAAASKAAKKILKEGKETNNAVLIGAANYILGLIDFRSGSRNNMMLAYALKAVAMFNESTDYEMVVRTNNLLGIAYSAMEEYSLALNAYNTALEVVKKHRITKYKNVIANNMVEAYSLLGDIERAIRYAERTVKDIKRTKDNSYSLLAVLEINLSEFYETNGQYDKALEALKEVKEYLKYDDRPIDNASYLSRSASVYYSKGNVKKGNEFADKMVELLNKGVDSYELHRDYEKIALKQIELGEYDRADVIGEFLWKYAEKTKMSLDQIVASRVQVAYFDKIGVDEQSLKHYRVLNECYMAREKELKSSQLVVEKKTEALNKEMQGFIRELNKREKLLEREPLTKLLNRNALSKVMNEFVDEAKEKGKKVGAVFIDVDFFKQFNDTYGHAKGDECLKKVAAICSAEENSNVKFARYGGDEFFGIVYGYSDEKLAEMAKRIAKTVAYHKIAHKMNPKGGKVTLSIGVLNMDVSHGGSLIDIVNYSDKALYHAKDKGKNCIYMFDRIKHEKKKNEEEYILIK